VPFGPRWRSSVYLLIFAGGLFRISEGLIHGADHCVIKSPRSASRVEDGPPRVDRTRLGSSFDDRRWKLAVRCPRRSRQLFGVTVIAYPVGPPALRRQALRLRIRPCDADVRRARHRSWHRLHSSRSNAPPDRAREHRA
jgi:hypothetical protein